MRITRTWHWAGLLILLVGGLAGCAPAAEEPHRPAAVEPTPSENTPSAAPSPSGEPTASESESVVFLSVVDGDTIETSAGTVRIIGIDTPESGQCGHDEASAAIGRLLSVGDPVTLQLPRGQNDRDRYGRLLRFVTTDAGVDLGLMQLEAGNALARYDSRDGYPEHPHEVAYRAAQLASPGSDGSVITVVCRAAAPAPVVPSTEDAWWQQYSSCARLKRNEAGHPTGPFARDDPAQVEIYNWFAYGTGNRGDGDGDGLACE